MTITKGRVSGGIAEPFTPEQTAHISARQQAQQETATGGNLLRMIADHGPPELEELRARRAELVAEIRRVNARIADLETHLLVGNGAEPEVPPASRAQEAG